jgi:hypothetical protein
VWLFHAFIFVVPYWVTKFFIKEDGNLLPEKWWLQVLGFLKALVKTCFIIIFFLFSGGNNEEPGESTSPFNGELILTAFIVIFLGTLFGFYFGHRQVKNDKQKQGDLLKKNI